MQSKVSRIVKTVTVACGKKVAGELRLQPTNPIIVGGSLLFTNEKNNI